MMQRKRKPVLEAAQHADWVQVVLNGGPPCFHLDGDRFCLRAERWAGHGDLHEFVSLHALLEKLIGRGRQDEATIAKRALARWGGKTAADRFWARVDKSGDCWLWKKHGKRYGVIYVKGRGNIEVHRFSWELHHGPIPKGLHVLHQCDVPLCVNPSHLRLGTHADNMRDMDDRGRRAVLRGEAHGRAKISAAEARAIYAFRGSTAECARRFGVSYSNAWGIRAGRSWVDATGATQ